MSKVHFKASSSRKRGSNRPSHDSRWSLPSAPTEGEDDTAVLKPDLESGGIRVVNVDGQEVVLFTVEGCRYAIANRCPHRGGPLARGSLEFSDGAVAVRCPLHGWLFDLKTGRCLNQPGACTTVYSVQLQDGDLRLTAVYSTP